MDKRIKIRLTGLTETGYSYQVLEGESSEIFKDIFGKTGGQDNDGDGAIKDCKLWLVVHPMEDLLNAGDRSQNGKAPLTQDLLLDKREEQENKGEKKEEKKKRKN